MSLRTLIAGLGALVVLAPTVGAQTCAERIEEAQGLYIEGAFGTAIALLEPCLDASARSVPARRLTVLSHLQLGEIAAATREYLALLEVRPGYEPDALRDPPAYLGLAQAVEAQLAAQPPEPAPPEPTPARPEPAPVEPASPLPPDPADAGPPDPPAPDPVPPQRPDPAPDLAAGASEGAAFLQVRYWVAVGSYGGERGIQSSGLGEFTSNAGVGLGTGIEAKLTEWLSLYGDLEAVRYPTLSRERGVNATFDSIDASFFSKWVRYATVGVRAAALDIGPARLYGSVGGGVASGDGGVGGLVSLAGGAALVSSGPSSAFVESSASLVFPSRAIDAAARPTAIGDVFSAIRLGLRYRLD